MATAITLEDEVLGLDSRDAAAEPKPRPGDPGAPAVVVDPVSQVMLPLVGACILIGTSVWSVSRSVRYHEIFVVNPRFQYGLYAMNTVIILVTVLLLCRRRRLLEWGW